MGFDDRTKGLTVQSDLSEIMVDAIVQRVSLVAEEEIKPLAGWLVGPLSFSLNLLD